MSKNLKKWITNNASSEGTEWMLTFKFDSANSAAISILRHQVKDVSEYSGVKIEKLAELARLLLLETDSKIRRILFSGGWVDENGNMPLTQKDENGNLDRLAMVFVGDMLNS